MWNAPRSSIRPLTRPRISVRNAMISSCKGANACSISARRSEMISPNVSTRASRLTKKPPDGSSVGV